MYFQWVNKEVEGTPLLLIHGFLESHTMWLHLHLERLNRPVLLVDVPGHGKSPLTDDQEPSIAYLAREILQELTNQQITTVDVVGHSMGGYIALELVFSDARISKVMLLNSNFWADSEVKKRDRIRVADILLSKNRTFFLHEAIPNLFAASDEHHTFIQSVIDEAGAMVPEGLAYAALAMRNRQDFSGKMESIESKLTVVQGELDSIVPFNDMLTARNGKAIILVKQAGHMVHVEQPERCFELLDTWK